MTTSGGTSNNSSSASMNQIPNWKDQLLSTDSRARLMGASSFRKLLSTHRDVASIEKVVQQNVIPIFIKFLGSNSSPELQFETAWVLTNVTSSSMEFTMHVIHHGAAPPLISLLRSKNQKVREQALWCLGNIAADFPFHLLHLHVLPPLFELLRANPNSKVLGLASWTLKNLCRNQTDLATVAEIAPAFLDLVMQKDIEIFGEACYGFSSLLDAVTYESLVHSLDDKTANRIPDLITRFVELLNLNNGPLVKAILRCLCKIVKSEAENREMAIELGVMGQLKKLLLASNPEIRQEACWAVCSILSGSRDDIQAILDAELIPDLLLLLINSEESEKRVIACAFNNASNTATSAQLKILADKGCILALCNLLSAENNLIKKASLEAIANFLRTAEKTKSYTIYLKGYVTLLQKLKDEGTECSSIASYLIENYLDSKQHGSSNKLIHEFLNENYITLDIIQPEIDESMLSSKIHKRPEENEENMLLISLVASARSILQKAESLSNHYAMKSESGRAIDHEKLKELAQIANQLDTQLLPSQQPSNS